MDLQFPDEFAFGTSTSAYQIETPVGHDWMGVRARDGKIFDHTTRHEAQIESDVSIIAFLAPHYRMSLMWSKLQHAPFENFNTDAVLEYSRLLKLLQSKGVSVMMVIHHFANPLWFTASGGWENKSNIDVFVDFGKKLVDEFSDYVSSWNTFNEPNLYVSMGWIAGEFPPFKRQITTAWRVINNIAEAHNQLYAYIKKVSKAPVGISHNCTVFGAENFLGKLPATFFDWCYMEYPSSLFSNTDFFGMSYYARIGHDPMPITYLNTPEKIKKRGKQHDDMWEYYPQGLGECIDRFWNKYRKPIIITENGICTQHDEQRVAAIHDYLTIVHDKIKKGVDIKGYYHWSAWDNFEWSLGPSYRFGLYGWDEEKQQKYKKPSADIYSEIAHSGKVRVRAAEQASQR